jgi:hypothetical protein
VQAGSSALPGAAAPALSTPAQAGGSAGSASCHYQLVQDTQCTSKGGKLADGAPLTRRAAQAQCDSDPLCGGLLWLAEWDYETPNTATAHVDGVRLQVRDATRSLPQHTDRPACVRWAGLGEGSARQRGGPERAVLRGSSPAPRARALPSHARALASHAHCAGQVCAPAGREGAGAGGRKCAPNWNVLVKVRWRTASHSTVPSHADGRARRGRWD